MHRREALRTGLGFAVGTRLPQGPADRRAPRPFEPLGRVAIPNAAEAVTDGTFAYVATGEGYAVVDVTDPRSPEVVAERADLLVNPFEGPMQAVRDVSLDGDRLLAAGPAHGDVGGERGMVVEDVSDPTAPTRETYLVTEYPIHNCYLRGRYAYLTGNDFAGNPVVIVDTARRPAEVVGSWSVAEVDPGWLTVPPLFRVVHDVTVHDGIAYVAHWEAGTWLVDVSDPTEPRAVSSVGDHALAELSNYPADRIDQEYLTPPGNSHYATVDDAGDLLAIGKETWARTPPGGDRPTGGSSGIELWDVRDPEAPVHLSTIDPPPAPVGTRDGLWTTAHNFGFRGDRLYSAWYHGGVRVHDVSDPGSPRELAWWRRPSTARFWTARPAPPGEFFVASDMGSWSGGAGLVTFPDRPGEQADPPDLTAMTPPTPTPTPTSTPTPTPSSTATAPSTGTATTAPTGSGSRTRSTPAPGEGTESSPSTDASGPGSDVRSPGFGAGLAAVAVGVAGWLAAGRDGE